MNETIATIVVTYNRKNLLIECIDSICNQSSQPNALYIIDNCSADGTVELLYESGYISFIPEIEVSKDQITISHIKPKSNSEELLKIVYVRKFENDGGAGGFHEGIKRAFNDGYSWIWMMDDDVEPKHDALETLLKWRNKGKLIQPSRKNIDGSTFNWGGDFILENGKEFQSPFHEQCLINKGYSIVTVGCFEGMFISREIIEKIGFPDKRFFIYGDDAIYGYLASQFTEIILIKEELIIRKLPPNKKHLKLLWKNIPLLNSFSSYYQIRNEFLKREILRNNNLQFSNSKYLYKIVRSFLIQIFLSAIIFDYSRLFSICLGFTHGVKGRFGKR